MAEVGRQFYHRPDRGHPGGLGVAFIASVNGGWTSADRGGCCEWGAGQPVVLRMGLNSGLG